MSHHSLCIADAGALLVDVDAPSYSLSIFDNFTTADGQDLDGQCTQGYTLDWQMEVVAMVTTMNNQLSSGELCPGEDVMLNVMSSTTTFVSQGNEVGLLVSELVDVVSVELNIDESTFREAGISGSAN